MDELSGFSRRKLTSHSFSFRRRFRHQPFLVFVSRLPLARVSLLFCFLYELKRHRLATLAAATTTTTSRPSPPWFMTSQPSVWSTAKPTVRPPSRITTPSAQQPPQPPAPSTPALPITTTPRSVHFKHFRIKIRNPLFFEPILSIYSIYNFSNFKFSVSKYCFFASLGEKIEKMSVIIFIHIGERYVAVEWMIFFPN